MTLSVLEQFSFSYEERLSEGKDQIVVPLQGHVVSLWYRDGKDRKLRTKFEIKNLGNKPVGQGVIEASFGTKDRIRTTAAFEFLPVPSEGAGNYFFLVYLEQNRKWRQVAKVPLQITIKKLRPSRAS